LLIPWLQISYPLPSLSSPWGSLAWGASVYGSVNGR
jgi:hypothetical protein